MLRRHASFHDRLSLAALALVLAACSSSTGPQPITERRLDPAGTRTAVTALATPFQSPAVQSFGHFGTAMRAKLGAAALAVSPRLGNGVASANPRGTLAFAAAQARAAATPAAASTSLSIPTTSLGRTFEWDVTLQDYVPAVTPPADLPPVPANGVRFLLYAWNPVFNTITLPLNRIGFTDYLETTDANGRTIRVTVTNGTAIALDYSANARFAQATGTFTTTMEGFATEGTTRADFSLTNAASTANSGSLQIDYVVRVDAEQLRAENRQAFANLVSGAPITLDVGLALVMATTRVDVQGILSAPRPADPVENASEIEGFAGTLAVTLNGAPYATITKPADGEESITTPAGAPLPDDDANAISRVFDMIGAAVGFVQDLVEPVESLLDLN